MYDYNELYKTCDSVLEKFSEKQTRIEQSEITHNIPNATPSLVLSAIYQLILDNFLLKDSNTVNVFIAITGQGFNLKLKGGYKPYLLELKSKSQLQDSVNTSVINTNNLVGQNVRTQERLTKFALLIAGIAVIVPTITLVKDIVSPNQLIDKDTKLLMKNTQVTIDSLKQSLDSLNVSLKSSKNVSYKINTAKKQ